MVCSAADGLRLMSNFHSTTIGRQFWPEPVCLPCTMELPWAAPQLKSPARGRFLAASCAPVTGFDNKICDFGWHQGSSEQITAPCASADSGGLPRCTCSQ